MTKHATCLLQRGIGLLFLLLLTMPAQAQDSISRPPVYTYNYVFTFNQGWGRDWISKQYFSDSKRAKWADVTSVRFTHVWNTTRKLVWGAGMHYIHSRNEARTSDRQNEYIVANHLSPQASLAYCWPENLYLHLNAGIGYTCYKNKDQKGVYGNALSTDISLSLNALFTKHWGLGFEIGYLHDLWAKTHQAKPAKKIGPQGQKGKRSMQINLMASLFFCL